jgi:hypothetical protein
MSVSNILWEKKRLLGKKYKYFQTSTTFREMSLSKLAIKVDNLITKMTKKPTKAFRHVRIYT